MLLLWRKVEEERGSGNRRAVSPVWRATATKVAVGWLVCSALLLLPPRVSADSDDDAEYRLKLAFLYNFAQFVIWPTDAFHGPGAPLTVCVAGQNPFLGEIGQDLQGRSAGGHPIQIKKLKPGDEPRTCQMIFFRAGEKKAPAGLLAAVRGSSTLTVGETKGFIALGGVINLIRDENKLRFEVNLDAARQTRLKISSKLLALAKIVKTDR